MGWARSPHPWWRHLPAQRQRKRHQLGLRGRRLKAWLAHRRQRIWLTIGFYLLLCGLPLLIGLPVLGLVALLPLLLVPPVGYLVYWLVWKDYHH